MKEMSNNPAGYMTDSQCRLVPVGMVSEIDKLRDETVRAITAQAAAMQEQLLAFKRKIRNDLLAYIELSFERYGKKFGGKEGNVTLTSYDGKYRLTLAVDKVLYFDEGLQAAKSLIDGCITRWTEGSRAEILTLINDAFYAEKGGSVNAARILGLRRLQIEDPQWKRSRTAYRYLGRKNICGFTGGTGTGNTSVCPWTQRRCNTARRVWTSPAVFGGTEWK